MGECKLRYDYIWYWFWFWFWFGTYKLIDRVVEVQDKLCLLRLDKYFRVQSLINANKLRLEAKLDETPLLGLMPTSNKVEQASYI